jgi:conjugative transfer signal peptidase TraF
VSRALIAACGTAGLAALVAPAVLRPPTALLWNATASAPVGLYWVHEGRSLAVGDWVAARAPEDLRTTFAERRYLPAGVPLVKRIAAVAAQRVCRLGAPVTIDQRAVARALTDDRMGRPLPSWRGCRKLQRGEVFLLNPDPDSLDGRYFGPISARNVVGRLTPLWIVGGASR